MVATDRISAFDIILPRAIPYKGQVLNQIASKSLDDTADIVPNWKISSPDPNVTVGIKCEPYKVEMVIRSYLVGHAWRVYNGGDRFICGIALPNGLKENDKLPAPIITPSTKADEGHDEDISREDIIRKGIVPEDEYQQLEKYTRELFSRGTEVAGNRGLILADTKYEFGRSNDKILLIDEIHTPDSSRYFYSNGYEEKQDNGEPQKQLSKEFVRQWLISCGFQGLEGQQMPEWSDDKVNEISSRYIELFEQFTGSMLKKEISTPIHERIHNNILNWLKIE
jgi:phosphoribosylaminoimidazole-succinocarboxamide synthase